MCFETLSKTFKFLLNLTKIMGTLQEDRYILVIISLSVLRMRNVSGIIVEEIKTHILPSITIYRKSCRVWDNVGKYCTAGQATGDHIIWRMRIACWIPKATKTDSECVIIIAFPLQIVCTNAAPCYAICTLPVLLCNDSFRCEVVLCGIQCRSLGIT
jgi:hypothetical protein